MSLRGGERDDLMASAIDAEVDTTLRLLGRHYFAIIKLQTIYKALKIRAVAK